MEAAVMEAAGMGGVAGMPLTVPLSAHDLATGSVSAHDAVLGEADMSGEKRKRRPSAQSMANLRHDKRCPECQKLHGNAKRGRCNGNNGTCAYEFKLSKRAKSAGMNPSKLESLPGSKTLKLTKISSKFKEMRELANSIATELGVSIYISAAGALNDDSKESRDMKCDPYVKDFAVEDNSLAPQTIKVGVIRHGVGLPAREMMAKRELVQLHSRIAFTNLKNQILQKAGIRPASQQEQLMHSEPLLKPDMTLPTVSLDVLATTQLLHPMAMDTLESFLARLNASQYLPVLQKEDIHLNDILTCMSETDLQNLGLPMGPRRRIMSEVQRSRGMPVLPH